MTTTVFLVVLISSLAYILGGFLVLIRKNWPERTLLSLVALSAGLLLSIALLHLIPHALEDFHDSSLFVMLGFLIMYFIFLPGTFHGKNGVENSGKSGATGLTIGMLLHNFFEGLSIGISYASSFELGIFVTIALVIHKIPEGLSYTSVMLAFLNGRKKTAIYLVIQGLFTWLGAGIAVLLSEMKDFQETIVAMGLSVTAGIFLYLSGAMLLPLINRGTFKSTPLFFIAGILLFFILHSVA
ncbi:ZIP family metal transporter [Neobacillus citreus]|uniref:ZIP family metal transporter n=1 Tax=Neobacillus citreus TaxID=2833578 RepID=A0A942YBK7_9BACI|nr:ZIP family metal transporter [Neobacillus citreus]MCH6264382.1 ZIP family metal transporter [Neobacillus citreus]